MYMTLRACYDCDSQERQIPTPDAPVSLGTLDLSRDGNQKKVKD